MRQFSNFAVAPKPKLLRPLACVVCPITEIAIRPRSALQGSNARECDARDPMEVSDQLSVDGAHGCDCTE